MQLAQLAHAMPAERFETLIRELLAQMGFDENTVKVTPYSGDGLIDVTGTYRAVDTLRRSQSPRNAPCRALRGRVYYVKDTGD